MKPIHKFNGGKGATLCHKCSVIISEGLTEDLYCEKCEQKQHLVDMMQDDEKLGLYDEPKQETLEEAKDTAWNIYEHVEGHLYSTSFKNGFEAGAKWQAERMYSEEEVLKFTQTILMQYKFGNTDIEQMDLLRETFQLFKKK